jgi:uncharacterized protein YjbI with pentapeptide repeats
MVVNTVARWDWLGLTEERWRKEPDEEVRPAKTAWDVLQVAVIPVALVLIALAFNAAQTSRDRERDETRTREDRALALDARRDRTLETYLTRMSNLMLDRNLLKSPPESDVRAVARTLTLTTLRRLDGARKGEVVLFLGGSHLIDVGARKRAPKCARRGSEKCVVDPISASDAVVDLRGADLSHLDLSNGSLYRVDLGGAVLRNAIFDNALLSDVKLHGSDIRDASFRRTILRAVTMTLSRLEGAYFDGAQILTAIELGESGREWSVRSKLNSTCLAEASFVDAAIDRTDLTGADGEHTDFRGAKLTHTLARVATLSSSDLENARGAPSAWARPPLRKSRWGRPCSSLDPARRSDFPLIP